MEIMNEYSSPQWRDTYKKMQDIFKKNNELNIKTFENIIKINFFNPFIGIQKPEEILQTQFSILIENSQHNLYYMTKSFEILQDVIFFIYDQNNISKLSNSSNVLETMDAPDTTHDSNSTHASKNPLSVQKSMNNQDSTANLKEEVDPLHSSNEIMKPLIDHNIHPDESSLTAAMKPSPRKNKSYSDNTKPKYPVSDDKPWNLKK